MIAPERLVGGAFALPLDGPRRSLGWALAEDKSLIIRVARRDVEQVLAWLDYHDRRADACSALVDIDADRDADMEACGDAA